MVEIRRFVVVTGFVCLSALVCVPRALAQEKAETPVAQEASSPVTAEGGTPAAPLGPGVTVEGGTLVAPTDSSVATEAPVFQESAPSAPAETPAASGAPAQKSLDEAAEEKPSEWVWGEVVSADAALKHIIIKHLDYETYEEVQMTLAVDEKTLYENAFALDDIKAGDHVTVDYKAKEGVNVAGLVVVEKKEVSVAETTASATTDEKKDEIAPAAPGVEAAAPAAEPAPAAAPPAQDVSVPVAAVPEVAAEPSQPPQETPIAPTEAAPSPEKAP